MPDDIFLPPEPAITTPKLRWFEVVLANPVAGAPYLQALAETVPTVNGAFTGGPRTRASDHDLEVAFDPADPDHLLVYQALDRIVKKAYASPKPVDTPE
jgi:hypothetical protein